MGSKAKKIIALICCIALLASMFNGCGKKSDVNEGSSNTATSENTDTTDSSNKADDANDAASGEPVELTFWYPLGADALRDMKHYGENEVFTHVGNLLNTKVTFIHPVDGTASEAFALFFASDNLPDFIYTDAKLQYVDGPEAAVQDGYYLDLTDIADEYCPNYMKIINENEALQKLSVTDNGIRWCFNFIYKGGRKANYGPVIRKDFLDKVGETVPVTYDDWYRVLTKFKNELGIESPIYIPYGDGDLTINDWMAGFNTAKDFFVKDGTTVTYGPLEDGYKEYLDTLAKWYAEGLLDSNFSIRDSHIPEDDLVFNDKIGAWTSYASWTGTEYYPGRGATNPDFNLAGAPIPAKNAGDERHLRSTDLLVNTMQIAVSAKTKHMKEALTWMDFFYGEEGTKMMNYGLREGETYVVQPDGSLRWGPQILNNPEGMTLSEARVYYTSNNAFYEDYTRVSSNWLDIQKESQQTWVASKDDWVIPAGVNLTAEENQEFSSIMTEIRTYVTEETVKYIMGLSKTSFDDFKNQIKSMGIDRATELYQAAVNRYLSR